MQSSPQSPNKIQSIVFTLVLASLFGLLIWVVWIAQADASTLRAAQSYKEQQLYKRLAMAKKVDKLGHQAYMTVTAYTGVESCQNSGCLMANGQRAYVGAAACPRRMKFGSKVTIAGLGTYSCADRTATWVDGRVDLFFGYTESDYQRAIQFGKQVKLVTLHD